MRNVVKYRYLREIVILRIQQVSIHQKGSTTACNFSHRSRHPTLEKEIIYRDFRDSRGGTLSVITPRYSV